MGCARACECMQYDVDVYSKDVMYVNRGLCGDVHQVYDPNDMDPLYIGNLIEWNSDFRLQVFIATFFYYQVTKSDFRIKWI